MFYRHYFVQRPYVCLLAFFSIAVFGILMNNSTNAIEDGKRDSSFGTALGLELQSSHDEGDAISALDLAEASNPLELRRRLVENFDRDGNYFLNFHFDYPSYGKIYDSRSISVMRSGIYRYEDKFIPAIVAYSDAFSKRIQSEDLEIYVRVPGGPGAAQILSDTHSVIDYSDKTVSIDLHYTGNGFNTLHPYPSFRIAADQVASFLIQLRRRNPQAKIILLGESLGAVISVEALRLMEENRSQSSLINKLILLSPPFGTLDETVEKMDELFDRPLLGEAIREYRIRSNNENYNEYGVIKKIHWRDFYERFYPEEEGDVRLFGRLARLSQLPPTLVIYGDEDERILPELADQFEKVPMGGVDLIPIKGMEHSIMPGREQLDVRYEISMFVAD